MKSSGDHTPSRRAVIKGLVAALAGTTAAAATGAANAGIFSRIQDIRRFGPFGGIGKSIVYRLQSRGTRACRACQVHHRYIVFLSRALADANRAHKGCNCPIVTQEISRLRFRRLFRRGSSGVARLRRGNV